MTRTYDARTGQWRDYDSLATFLDASDRQGMSVVAPPEPEPLLWEDCPACGLEVAVGLTCDCELP